MDQTTGAETDSTRSPYAGLPLTHRRFASVTAFVTGHEKPGKAAWDHVLQSAASPGFVEGPLLQGAASDLVPAGDEGRRSGPRDPFLEEPGGGQSLAPRPRRG